MVNRETAKPRAIEVNMVESDSAEETASTAGTNASEATGVVVGVDGSPGSRAALEWALNADPSLGLITPVAAWHLPWWTATLAGAAAPIRYYQMEHDIDEMLDEVVSSVGSSRLGDRVVAHGGAPSVLLEAAKDHALLVVGSRGHGVILDTILGSVGIACSLRTTTPMAVVPATGGDPAGPCIVGVDGSENAVAALVWAMRHAPAGAAVVAVNAWRPFAYAGIDLPESTVGQLERHSRTVLAEAIAKAGEQVPDAPIPEGVSLGGDPRSVLDSEAESASMLVIGARGDGGISNVVLGSVTTALLHQPPCPTIVIPAEPDAA